MTLPPLVAPDLATARLRLRPLVDADAVALAAYQGDPEVVRYLPYAPRSPREVQEYVIRFAERRRLRDDADRVIYAILPDAPTAADLGVDERTALGELHLVLHSAVGAEYELGWVLHPRAQGRGIAFEAAAAVRDLALQHGAHRIRAMLDPRNTASAALCARLGMRQEAHHRQDFAEAGGGWSDTAIWALVAGDPLPSA